MVPVHKGRSMEHHRWPADVRVQLSDGGGGEQPQPVQAQQGGACDYQTPLHEGWAGKALHPLAWGFGQRLCSPVDCSLACVARIHLAEPSSDPQLALPLCARSGEPPVPPAAVLASRRKGLPMHSGRPIGDCKHPDSSASRVAGRRPPQLRPSAAHVSFPPRASLQTPLQPWRQSAWGPRARARPCR